MRLFLHSGVIELGIWRWLRERFTLAVIVARVIHTARRAIEQLRRVRGGQLRPGRRCDHRRSWVYVVSSDVRRIVHNTVYLCLLVQNNIPDWILRNDVEAVKNTRQVPQKAQRNVDERLSGAHTTLDPHGKRREHKRYQHKYTITAANVATAHHLLISQFYGNQNTDKMSRQCVEKFTVRELKASAADNRLVLYREDAINFSPLGGAFLFLCWVFAAAGCSVAWAPLPRQRRKVSV